MIDETLTLQFDGGSRGNPGPAGIGVVLLAADGTEIFTFGKFIGRATNNVAEYRALITGLEQAKKLGAARLVVRGDSELIIKQMRGEYRVKNPDLRLLYETATALADSFDQIRFEHNLRHKNATADALANKAMDRKADVIDIDGTPASSGTLQARETSPPPAPSARGSSKLQTCPECGAEIEVKTPGRSAAGHFTCRCGTPMR